MLRIIRKLTYLVSMCRIPRLARLARNAKWMEFNLKNSK